MYSADGELVIISAPTGIQLDNLLLLENAVGAVVGQVLVEDVDSIDSHQWQVDDARFEVRGGLLRLKDGQSIDFETESEIELILSAVDSGGLAIRQKFVLEIANRNETPHVVVQPAARTVTTGESFQIPKHTFDDVDGDSLRYSTALENGDQLPGWLVFDPDTGSFTITESLRTVNELIVVVTASDQSGASTAAQFILNVEPLRAAAAIDEGAASVVSELRNTSPSTESEVQTTDLIDAPKNVDTATAEDNEISDPLDQTRLSASPVSALLLTTDADSRARDTAEREYEVVAHSAPERVVSEVMFQLQRDLGNVAFDLSLLPVSELSDQFSGLIQVLDRDSSKLRETMELQKRVVASVANIGVGLSVGYIIWIIRSGLLLSSVLASLPTWRFIDPIPVLGSSTGKADESDDESLAAIVDSRRAATDDSAQQAA